MRGFGNRQVEADVGLRSQVRVFALSGFKAEADFLFFGIGCPHRRMPGGTGFNGVTGFKDIKTVIGVVGEQRLQRLDDVLLRPRFMLPAHEGAAAATAEQHAFVD